MKNVFEKAVTDGIIERIQQLSPETIPAWGKMSPTQMLAHCAVSYEMVYENKHPKPKAFAKFMLKLFVKDMVVGKKPYKRNSRTAPAFMQSEEKDFDTEQKRLIEYITKTYEQGEAFFEQKESHSFGKLTVNEWNTMFYKHLDHHLAQFNV
ncbi:DUF1569 domain-containing protein [Crocinitomix sp.]|nr:DUF1569 domain-containing protein [Crocinitomix sp.]